MRVIKPDYFIQTTIFGNELQIIEQAARTCYKSENKMYNPEGTRKMVRNLIKNGHEAMLEHSFLSVKFICDRGVSHEIVRHRHFSFAQESTRYCNYSGDKFENELTFIQPSFFVCAPDYIVWSHAMENAEKAYLDLIENGATPQEARSVLPNSVKTEIVVSGNYREWRHFFKLRAARYTGPAHPQMEELAQPLLAELHDLIPVIFDDIYDHMIEEVRKATDIPAERKIEILGEMPTYHQEYDTTNRT